MNLQPCKLIVVAAAFLIIGFRVSAQTNSVSIGTSSTDPTAVLWLVGNNQGLILPITSDVTAMPKKTGMVVYSSGKVYSCDGTTWTAIGGGSGGSQTLT